MFLKRRRLLLGNRALSCEDDVTVEEILSMAFSRGNTDLRSKLFFELVSRLGSSSPVSRSLESSALDFWGIWGVWFAICPFLCFDQSSSVTITVYFFVLINLLPSP